MGCAAESPAGRESCQAGYNPPVALKATELYGKIVERMALVDMKDDWKAALQIQEGLLAGNRFVPIGDVLIQEGALDAAGNHAVVVQHKVTNVLQDDKILGDWLIDRGLADAETVKTCSQETRLAVRKGAKMIPRLVSLLVQKEVLAGEARDLALRIHHEVLAPLHEMTRYFTQLVDPADPEVTGGRLAYQNHHVSREDLFAALLTKVTGDGKVHVLATLRRNDRLSAVAQGTIAEWLSRFGG